MPAGGSHHNFSGLGIDGNGAILELGFTKVLRRLSGRVLAARLTELAVNLQPGAGLLDKASRDWFGGVYWREVSWRHIRFFYYVAAISAVGEIPLLVVRAGSCSAEATGATPLLVNGRLSQPFPMVPVELGLLALVARPGNGARWTHIAMFRLGSR